MIITVEVTPSDADESSEVKVREINAHLKGQGNDDRTRYAEKVRKRKKEKKREREKKEKDGKKSVYVIHRTN